MHTRTWSALPRALLVAGLCTACSSLGTEGVPTGASGWGGVARPAVAGPGGADGLMGFLALAEPGDATIVTSHEAGGTVRVSVEKDYQAASGRSCRRLLVVAGDGRPTPRVACRDGVGVWRLLPLLRNRELPAMEALPQPSAGPGP